MVQRFKCTVCEISLLPYCTFEGDKCLCGKGTMQPYEREAVDSDNEYWMYQQLEQEARDET